MKQLIAALEAKHPGCSVVEIRFMLEPGADPFVPDEEMDRKLAIAVMNAVPVNPAELFSV